MVNEAKGSSSFQAQGQKRCCPASLGAEGQRSDCERRQTLHNPSISQSQRCQQHRTRQLGDRGSLQVKV